MILLFEGWVDCPHSYTYVNVNVLRILMKIKDLQIYIKEVDLFNPAWSKHCIKGVTIDPDVYDAIKSLPKWSGEKVDIVWRSSFPYNIEPLDDGTPICFQYTAEFQEIDRNYITKPDNLCKLNEYMHHNRVWGITPSCWNISYGWFVTGQSEFVKIIPHGCDVDKFYPDIGAGLKIRTTLKIPVNDFVFLNLGAMTGNKNIIGIVRGFISMRLKHGNVSLILKGTDALYESSRFLMHYIQIAIRDSGISITDWSEKIQPGIFLCCNTLNYENMRAIYNSADCYLTPYCAEGFNLPALEAEACGIPVIATGGGPTDDFLSKDCNLFVRSQILPGFSGFGRSLYTKLEDIEKAMEHMYYHKLEFREKARTYGVEMVRKSFRWDDVGDLYYNAFKEIIKRHSK
jgi:glycosyltransferase involved in cell wall biosynthesis